MSRIEAALAKRTGEGKKAIMAYLCIGDPNEEASVELALACSEAGADVIELGTPFSDPSADGAAIARAGQRALARGGGLDQTLRVARAVRERSDVPMVLFGYYNPLFVRGEERAAEQVADAGIDALLVVDVPLDESMPLRQAAASRGLGLVPLVAPTTRPERVTRIAELSESYPIPFIYYVSMLGVTGGAGASAVLASASTEAGRVRDATKRPTVVGFGIDSAERARIAAKDSDGIVVGSELVRRIERAATTEQAIASVRELVRELRAAV